MIQLESVGEFVSLLRYIIKITIFFYMIYILFGTAYISFLNHIKNVNGSNDIINGANI